MQTTSNYWRQHLKAATPNLFLTRLLQTLDVPMDLPLQRYYSLIDAKALGLSMALKMTSSIYKGSPFEGTFYSAPTVEYLLADDSPVDPAEVNAHWQYAQTVTVLMHPKSDLQLVLPVADPYSLEAGVAVVRIHIPALAVQYRAFMLEQRDNPVGGETTQMFIERYVLPNMLPSQTEVALFNRLHRFVSGNRHPSMVNSHAKTPFQLPHYEGKIDNVLYDVCENYATVDPTFEKLLRNTPAIYAPDALEAFQLPKLAMTAQVEWLLVIARLKMYDYLVKIAGKAALTKNQLEVSQLLRTFRDPDVNSQIDRLPYEAGQSIRTYVQTLRDLAKVY